MEIWVIVGNILAIVAISFGMLLCLDIVMFLISIMVDLALDFHLNDWVKTVQLKTPRRYIRDRKQAKIDEAARAFKAVLAKEKQESMLYREERRYQRKLEQNNWSRQFDILDGKDPDFVAADEVFARLTKNYVRGNIITVPYYYPKSQQVWGVRNRNVFEEN